MKADAIYLTVHNHAATPAQISISVYLWTYLPKSCDCPVAQSGLCDIYSIAGLL